MVAVNDDKALIEQPRPAELVEEEAKLLVKIIYREKIVADERSLQLGRQRQRPARQLRKIIGVVAREGDDEAVEGLSSGG